MKNEETPEHLDSKMIQCIRKLPLLITPRLKKGGELTQEMKGTLRNFVNVFCNKGYIRTHAFLSSWLRDYTINGTLQEKEIHDIVDSCPWSSDQTRKYLHLLEKDDYFIVARNDKKKTYRLNISPENYPSSELQRLLTYYSKIYRVDSLNDNFFEQALLMYRNCISMTQNFERKKKMLDLKSKKISQATDEDMANLNEQLVRAFSEIYEEDSLNASTRLTKILVKDSLLFRGLKRER